MNRLPTEKQRELLDQILHTLPKSEPWEQWLKATQSLLAASEGKVQVVVTFEPNVR
jgi:hypothetical protein